MSEKNQGIGLKSAEELKKPVKKRDPKKGRTLLIALMAIVLLAAVVLGVTKLAQVIKAQIDLNVDHTLRLSETTIDDVKKIEIDGKTAVTITKRGGVYSIRELSASVTSQTACEAAFSNAATLLSEGIAAENVTDFTDYGLNEPMATTVITYAGDKTLTLEIGSIAPASQHYYVRVDGGDTVYLMRKMIVDMYSAGVAAYRDITGFTVATQGIRQLVVTNGDDVFQLVRHDTTHDAVFTPWQITLPLAANVDSAKTENAIELIADTKLSSFVKTTKEKAEYGLDAPWRKLELTYSDDTTFTMELGATDSIGNFYACFDGGDDIYLIEKDSVAVLGSFTLEQLTNEFANIVALPGVQSLTVELDGASVVFSIDRSGEDPVYSKDGAVIDAQQFKDAFQATNTVVVNDFVSGADVEGAQPSLTLTYLFSSGQEYVVKYLDYSINNLALDKNGSVSVAVSKEACADALDQWRALLDQ